MQASLQSKKSVLVSFIDRSKQLEEPSVGKWEEGVADQIEEQQNILPQAGQFSGKAVCCSNSGWTKVQGAREGEELKPIWLTSIFFQLINGEDSSANH